jgi:PIN domain nuclease of toxin-antitoxin system
MKNLLDTHTVMWLAVNSPKLSERAKQAIFAPENESFVSIASAWEVAIKIGKGKLQLDGGVTEFFRIIDENGFKITPDQKELCEIVGNTAISPPRSV